ncbi:phytoene/squalene synthase family protein [Methylobacterium sp. W2]|uniref:phytoene/squalene synthase family protein n=1 Tax=Methylobacterium sp. W2 TaxID=2598107 RepID=UPI001D0C4193|nr:phytoene/squalene synthase family protein [Methylobacterium sp. W2]MCC0808408.1 phytoene/squalene synthase family protein [Methylobacterium sp. W2]
MRASSLELSRLELARPPLWAIPHADAADHAACRAAIRTGSRSFFAASALLPPSIRRPAYGLYAFCRLSDDAVDDVAESGRRPAVARLRLRLARAYDGQPCDAPADRALADIVADHAIPQALPAALIEGLAWDAAGQRYETLADLTAYAARVAASVGAMMTLVMGVRDPDVLARACDLGIAMQFTNIARDVGEDARAGRLYLPRAWLREAGIDPDGFLRAPTFTPALGGVVARLLAAADLLYARSESGIAGLPPACRPAIRAARLIYAEIGRAVERAGYDSVSRRARVDGRRKLALLARALVSTDNTAALREKPLPEILFLIEAVAARPSRAPRTPPWWNVPAQVAQVLDLVETLREREALGRAPAPS